MKKMMMMAAVCLMAAMTFAAAQCMAKTQDGSPCKREALEGRKLCWQHAKAVAQCAAVTEDGKKCTRKTEPGKKFCWQHDKDKPPAKNKP